jgi:hypothetical protein
MNNRIRIYCNGSDIVLAIDKITSMMMTKETADGGIEYYKLVIRVGYTETFTFRSDKRYKNSDNYLTEPVLWSIHNQFANGE